MLMLVRKVGITVSVSDKLDFRTKNINRKKEDHFIDKVASSKSGINSPKYLYS